MLVSHMRLLLKGLTPNIQPGKQQKMLQILGFPQAMKATWAEVLLCGVCPALPWFSSSFCKYLGNESDGNFSISSSLSPYLSNKKFPKINLLFNFIARKFLKYSHTHLIMTSILRNTYISLVEKLFLMEGHMVSNYSEKLLSKINLTRR